MASLNGFANACPYDVPVAHYRIGDRHQLGTRYERNNVDDIQKF